MKKIIIYFQFENAPNVDCLVIHTTVNFHSNNDLHKKIHDVEFLEESIDSNGQTDTFKTQVIKGALFSMKKVKAEVKKVIKDHFAESNYKVIFKKEINTGYANQIVKKLETLFVALAFYLSNFYQNLKSEYIYNLL